MGFSSNTKNYFNSEKIILKIAGLALTDKNDSESLLYKVYSYIGLYIFNLFYTFVSLYGLYGAKIEKDAETIAFNICVCLAIAVISTTTVNRKKLGRLLNKMEEKPFLADPERGGAEEESLIAKWFALTKMQTFAFYAVMLLFIICVVAFTFIKQITSDNPHDWMFPLGQLTILDVTNRTNYEILWFYQIIAMLSLGCKLCPIIVVIYETLSYACLQLQILQCYLRKMTINSFEKFPQGENVDCLLNSNDINVRKNASVSWKYLHQALQRAVSYHLKILEMISGIEDIFNMDILIIFMSVLAALCVILYAISQLPLHDPQALTLMTAALGLGVVPLPICYFGGQIAHESEEVARAAFEANFVGADLRFQKGLILIMGRSQRAVQIKAGKLIETTMITYGWILKTSLSYFMVIRKINTEAQQDN